MVLSADSTCGTSTGVACMTGRSEESGSNPTWGNILLLNFLGVFS